MWRKAINRKKETFERLQNSWNQAFTAITEPLTKKKTTRKGKQTQDMAVKRYFSISAATRLAVLQTFYQSQVKSFLSVVRSHLAERKMGISGDCPRLEVHLTMEMAKELIERAAERSEKLLSED